MTQTTAFSVTPVISLGRRTWSVTVAKEPSAIGMRRWAAIRRDGAHSVFQAQDWIEAWYRAAVHHANFQPLIVVVDDWRGECAMVLPLVLVTEGARRVIRFADFGVSDYNAPALGPAAPVTPRQMRSMWRSVRRSLPSADTIAFEKMPAMIGDRVNPLVWLPGTGLSVMTQSACAISMPYEAAREKLMPARFREKLDSSLKRLEKRAAVRFGAAETEADIALVFDALVRQKAERAKALGWDNILDDPVWREFYRTVALQGASGGSARTLALWVDDHPVAIILGFQKDERFCDILASFDAGKWKNHSLGLLVQDLAMGWAARQGITIYDMTIGAEGYKDDFGPTIEPLHEYVAATSAEGLGAMMVARAKSALRTQPALLAFAKRMLGRPSA